MSNEIQIKIPYYEKRKKLEMVFDLHITPNKFTVEYSKYTGRAQKVIELNQRRIEAKTVAELQEIEKEVDPDELEKLLELKYSLVKIMCEANGYDFNYDFWDSKADPKDVNDFINKSMLKDSDLYSKKKEVNT